MHTRWNIEAYNLCSMATKLGWPIYYGSYQLQVRSSYTPTIGFARECNIDATIQEVATL
jgi:hypothetical protein